MEGAVLGIVLTLGAVIAIVCGIVFGSKYTIQREVIPFYDPPRVTYRIYGRWPNNLICYGSAATQEEAERKVAKLDAAYDAGGVS